VSWLIVTDDFPPGFVGGISTWATDLGHALVAAGETVTVMARRTEGAEEADAMLPFPVVRVRGRSWARWQAVWTAGYALGRIGPGVRVVAATWRLARVLAPFIRLRGARLAVVSHGSDVTRLAVGDTGFAKTIEQAQVFLPVSQYLADQARRVDPRLSTAVAQLPMPLPDLVPSSAPSGEHLICLARLTSLKGVDRAIRLAHALGRPLHVVGDGAYRADLEMLTQQLDAEVVFFGSLTREESLEHLRQASACLLLPRPDQDGTGAEGLGLCLLEAAAVGVPVVGARTGGVPEAVGPGVILDDPDRFTPEDLQAVDALLADATAGETARAWVREQHGAELAVATLRRVLP